MDHSTLARHFLSADCSAAVRGQIAAQLKEHQHSVEAQTAWLRALQDTISISHNPSSLVAQLELLSLPAYQFPYAEQMPMSSVSVDVLFTTLKFFKNGEVPSVLQKCRSLIAATLLWHIHLLRLDASAQKNAAQILSTLLRFLPSASETNSDNIWLSFFGNFVDLFVAAGKASATLCSAESLKALSAAFVRVVLHQSDTVVLALQRLEQFLCDSDTAAVVKVSVATTCSTLLPAQQIFVDSTFALSIMHPLLLNCVSSDQVVLRADGLNGLMAFLTAIIAAKFPVCPLSVDQIEEVTQLAVTRGCEPGVPVKSITGLLRVAIQLHSTSVSDQISHLLWLHSVISQLLSVAKSASLKLRSVLTVISELLVFLELDVAKQNADALVTLAVDALTEQSTASAACNLICSLIDLLGADRHPTTNALPLWTRSLMSILVKPPSPTAEHKQLLVPKACWQLGLQQIDDAESSCSQMDQHGFITSQGRRILDLLMPRLFRERTEGARRILEGLSEAGPAGLPALIMLTSSSSRKSLGLSLTKQFITQFDVKLLQSAVEHPDQSMSEKALALSCEHLPFDCALAVVRRFIELRCSSQQLLGQENVTAIRSLLATQACMMNSVVRFFVVTALWCLEEGAGDTLASNGLMLVTLLMDLHWLDEEHLPAPYTYRMFVEAVCVITLKRSGVEGSAAVLGQLLQAAPTLPVSDLCPMLSPEFFTSTLVPLLRSERDVDVEGAVQFLGVLFCKHPTTAVSEWLLDELHFHLTTAQTDLLKASTESPMHGPIAALRHLLKLKMDLSQESWDRAASLAQAVLKVTWQVVCSPGTEGSVAPVVAACAWRAAREACEFLGGLAVLQVRVDSVHVLAASIIQLLIAVTHKGVMFAASHAFSFICSQLWQLDNGYSISIILSSCLHALGVAKAESTCILPLITPQNFGNSINPEASRHFAAGFLVTTRRSGGVPALVVELLRANALSNLQAKNASILTGHVMAALLRLCDPHSVSQAEVVDQVRALFTLRTLLMDTETGVSVEVVKQVLPIMVLCLHHANATDYALRNAANMTLSACVRRARQCFQYLDLHRLLEIVGAAGSTASTTNGSLMSLSAINQQGLETSTLALLGCAELLAASSHGKYADTRHWQQVLGKARGYFSRVSVSRALAVLPHQGSLSATLNLVTEDLEALSRLSIGAHSNAAHGLFLQLGAVLRAQSVHCLDGDIRLLSVIQQLIPQMTGWPSLVQLALVESLFILLEKQPSATDLLRSRLCAAATHILSVCLWVCSPDVDAAATLLLEAYCRLLLQLNGPQALSLILSLPCARADECVGVCLQYLNDKGVDAVPSSQVVDYIWQLVLGARSRLVGPACSVAILFVNQHPPRLPSQCTSVRMMMQNVLQAWTSEVLLSARLGHACLLGALARCDVDVDVDVLSEWAKICAMWTLCTENYPAREASLLAISVYGLDRLLSKCDRAHLMLWLALVRLLDDDDDVIQNDAANMISQHCRRSMCTALAIKWCFEQMILTSDSALLSQVLYQWLLSASRSGGLDLLCGPTAEDALPEFTVERIGPLNATVAMLFPEAPTTHEESLFVIRCVAQALRMLIPESVAVPAAADEADSWKIKYARGLLGAAIPESMSAFVRAATGEDLFTGTLCENRFLNPSS